MQEASTENTPSGILLQVSLGPDGFMLTLTCPPELPSEALGALTPAATTPQDLPLNQPEKSFAFNGFKSDSFLKLNAFLKSVQEKKAKIRRDIQYFQSRLVEDSDELERKQNGLLSRLFTSKDTFAGLEQDIENHKRVLTGLQTQVQALSLTINLNLSAELQATAGRIAEKYNALLQCNKTWFIKSEVQNTDSSSSASRSIDREEIQFKATFPQDIPCNFTPLAFQDLSHKAAFLLPGLLVWFSEEQVLQLIPWWQSRIEFEPSRFIQSSPDIPSDSKIIDHTWEKVTDAGEPDKRFAANKQLPIVRFGELRIGVKDFFEWTYQFSNYESALDFHSSLMEFVFVQNTQLKNPHAGPEMLPSVSLEEFEKIKAFAVPYAQIVRDLEKNEAFINLIYLSPRIRQMPFEKPDELLQYLFVYDLLMCFSLVSDMDNTHSKETFAVLYTIALRLGHGAESYGQHKEVYSKGMPKYYTSLVDIIKPTLEKQKNDGHFQVAVLLSAYDRDLYEKYLSCLYRLASVVVKLDGKVTPQEEKGLKRIMQLTSIPAEELQKPAPKPEEKTEEKTENARPQATEKTTLEEAMQSLNELTGLTRVKQEIHSLINFIRVQKAREQQGLKSPSLSYHIVFTGNPGTGKTTVARIVARIYKALGILTQGHLVETDRSGLIAEYVGQTAVKVNKIVDSALNGVLFIDEAYAIVGDEQDSFGREAVATLIKRMEDNRDKLIVILAGYTAEMRDFIDTNPGFKSRFNRYIDFTDYTPEELILIFEGLCKKMDYRITPEAKGRLTEVFSAAHTGRDKSFGNGRFARNTFEKALEKQANRIASIPELTHDLLVTITAADIPV